MKVGSLFSGIGGFDKGLEDAGFTITWQVENDDYCRKILAKHWPTVPCHYDIRTIDWREIPAIDLICGGFPCQPFSVAGQRRGAADDRHLWPEVVRCLSVLQPTWFLGENVPGLANLGLDQVLIDLEGLGYEVQTLSIPACAVDAPHRRQRLWIVAYSNNKVWDQCNVADAECGRDARRERYRSEQNAPSADFEQCSEDVAHAASPISKWKLSESNRKQSRLASSNRWLPEPAVGRVAHGISHRVDRIRGLGNAVVPQIVEALGRMILEAEYDPTHPP